MPAMSSQRVRGPLSAALLVAAIVALGAAAGCVETAECNETSECGSDKICYEYRCLATCEDVDDCASDERCLPCLRVGEQQGKCFGSDASACVPEDE